MHGRKLLYKREHLDNHMPGINASNEISKANTNMLTNPVDYMTTYTPIIINTRRKFNQV
jgi:hypothetical protein